MVKILGVDPSLTCTGVCIMDATGKILDFRQFKPKAKEEKRYEEISNFISNYIKLHKPEYMSIEKQYTFGRFGNSILKVSEVVGVCKGCFYMNGGMKVIEIAPLTMKKVFGIANLKREEAKKAIVTIVTKMFKIEKKITNDEADAIGMALTGLKIITKQ